MVLAVAAALAAAYLWRDAGSGASDAPAAAPRAPVPPARAVEPPAVTVPPARNVFEYADQRPPLAAAPSATSAATPVPTVAPAASPSPALRLVGLVRHGGQLKAALAVFGETVVLGPGESAAGYTVISIDEEEGVRVRGPDGSAVQLTPGPG
ncbi:MAG: hypothetical protein DMF78_20115 [Acidobacteria bacterium]|nr:MAG: hypothetical protein DMF78_20115 [Acidobacteriota bacterium]